MKNEHKKRNLEKLSDELSGKDRDTKRLVDRMDSIQKCLMLLVDAVRDLAAVNIKNLHEIIFPAHFNISNIDEFPTKFSVENFPEVQEVSIKRPDWYRDPIEPSLYPEKMGIDWENFPKTLEVAMKRPEWYKDPIESKPFPEKIAIDWDHAPKQHDTQPTWMSSLFSQFFEVLTRLLTAIASNILRVKLERGEITQPQFFIQIDPETGKPIGEQKIIIQGGNVGSSGFVKNQSGALINPATDEKLANVLTELETIKLNTDTLESKLQTIIDLMSVGSAEIFQTKTILLNGNQTTTVITPAAGKRLRILGTRIAQEVNAADAILKFQISNRVVDFIASPNAGYATTNVRIEGAINEPLTAIIANAASGDRWLFTINYEEF